MKVESFLESPWMMWRRIWIIKILFIKVIGRFIRKNVSPKKYFIIMMPQNTSYFHTQIMNFCLGRKINSWNKKTICMPKKGFLTFFKKNMPQNTLLHPFFLNKRDPLPMDLFFCFDSLSYRKNIWTKINPRLNVWMKSWYIDWLLLIFNMQIFSCIL